MRKRDPFIRILKDARGWRLVALSGSALKLFLATLLSCAYEPGNAADGADLVPVQPGDWLVHMMDAARTAGLKDARTAQAAFEELAGAGLVTIQDRGKTNRGHWAKHLISVVDPAQWIKVVDEDQPPARNVGGPRARNAGGPPAKNVGGPPAKNAASFVLHPGGDTQSRRQTMQVEILAHEVQHAANSIQHLSPTPSDGTELQEGQREGQQEELQESRAAELQASSGELQEDEDPVAARWELIRQAYEQPAPKRNGGRVRA